VRLGRSEYHLHRSTAASVARLPSWPPCMALVPYRRSREGDSVSANEPPFFLPSAIVEEDRSTEDVCAVGPTTQGTVSMDDMVTSCATFPSHDHSPSPFRPNSIPYLRSSAVPSSESPPAANPADRRADGEHGKRCAVSSGAPLFPHQDFPQNLPPSPVSPPIQMQRSSARSPESPATDRSVASTCGLGGASCSTLSYKEALLSSPLHRTTPTPRRLCFTPIQDRPLCYRCLSPDHGICDCRDPVRCKGCGRFGHRRRGCELPPLTFVRSAPPFLLCADPSAPPSPRLRRTGSPLGAPSSPAPGPGAAAHQAASGALRRSFLTRPATPYPRHVAWPSPDSLPTATTVRASAKTLMAGIAPPVGHIGPPTFVPLRSIVPHPSASPTRRDYAEIFMPPSDGVERSR
jgi:hypothetical protein